MEGHERTPVGWFVGTLAATAAVIVVVGLSTSLAPFAPFAVVFAVVLMGIIWHRPLVASVVVASIVPAMAGLDRGLPVPGYKASELLLVVCLAPLLVRRVSRWRRMNAVDVALAGVALVGLAVGIINGRGGDFEVMDLLRDALFPAFTFATWWVVSRGISSKAETNIVLRWVLLVSVIPAFLGVLQFLDAPGVREMLLNGVGSGLLPEPGVEGPRRITGPFTIAHSLGGYLIVPLLVAAILLLRGNTEVLRTRTLAMVVALDTAALVLSVTVTTLLWVIVAFLVAAALVHRFQRAFVALVLAGALCTAVFWPSLQARYEQQTTPGAGTSEGLVPQTLQFRILVWQNDYIPLLAEAAPHGLALGPDDVAFQFTESQYITLILRGGVGLLLVTALSFVVLARRAWRATRTEPGSIGAAAAATFGILLFLPAACFVWPYVTNAGFPQSMFAMTGAVLALAGSPLEPAVARQLAIRRRAAALA